MNKLLLVIFLSVVALTASADGQDSAFLSARAAFQAGDLSRVTRYARQLTGYALYSYVVYWQLSLNMDHDSAADIQTFLHRYRNSPLADRLRASWLEKLGMAKDWRVFLAEYPYLEKKTVALRCLALQARFARHDRAARKIARALWFTGSSRPASCTPLFKRLAASGGLTTADAWVRFRLALERGNVSVAKAIVNYLPRSWALRRLGRVAADPQQFLRRRLFDFHHRQGRELALFAVYRLARTAPYRAAAYWKKISYHFSAADQAYAWGQLAYRAARQHDAIALTWYAKADKTQLHPVQLAWWAREALRTGRWRIVLEAIQAMPPAQRRQKAWRYWKAHALKAQGQLAKANALLAALSVNRSYYGQLANEDLGEVVGPRVTDYQATRRDIVMIGKRPGIQRALLLHRLGMRNEGIQEWDRAIRGLPDKMLLAAAALAYHDRWYDRAINAANRTRTLHDDTLRYPTPHYNLMTRDTSKLGLDKAWVYGLIRQESQFAMGAYSRAGAYGMMQVMPATGRWIARQLGIRHFRQRNLANLDTNVAFGTYYLKHVLDLMDNQVVLATAAYNAGPLRAERWRDAKPMNGAVYIETIPFTETRHYVQKVMSNTVYYASSFARRLVSLKQRLGTILGLPAATKTGGG